jgi:glutathione S-transferase
MLKLCGFRISNYHNKVRLALLEKGVPHEEDPGCLPSQKDDWVGRSPMGKVPILEVDGTTLSESEVICEYLEDAFPQKPLLPKDPIARARVRELITHLELHMELVARRLYGAVFFGGKVSDETREQVQKDLAKGCSHAAAPRKIRSVHRGQGTHARRLHCVRAPADRVARDEAGRTAQMRSKGLRS